jgi:ABC-2 type transport system ATP-binding protein
MLRPTGGNAWLCGFHCRREGLQARQRVGYLPGELPIYPELTGTRFLRFLQSVGRQSIDGSWLEHLLRRFDVSDVDLARPMRDYSHGMKRKLGIIQALGPQPPLLILDEPTNGLDPLMIEAFAQTLDELKRNRRTTIFLSSHVLSEVEKTCDRVGLIRRGELAAVESLAALRTRMPRRVVVTFVSPVSSTALSALDGVKAISTTEQSWSFEVSGPLGPLMAALAGLPIDDVKVEPFTLEDYVLEFYSSGVA